ncbi:unnamed protein product [Lepeophtheirus salmonis]|uniref:(salmon louse) hypothetical protein n=1 Tax=Lepeophtheirus salmonis TaxID=72036 RepID=A0A7R8CC79_LEPSM|nr:unnamed protein product [Lepeophtheirus salmonis]CAF2768417.1 unnamed protein product [Lepeophtheirus salmonis]
MGIPHWQCFSTHEGLVVDLKRRKLLNSAVLLATFGALSPGPTTEITAMASHNRCFAISPTKSIPLDDLPMPKVVMWVPIRHPLSQSNALHVVPVKNGGVCPCGDYRSLNGQSVIDRYPIPNIQEFASKFSSSNIFISRFAPSTFKSDTVPFRACIRGYSWTSTPSQGINYRPNDRNITDDDSGEEDNESSKSNDQI